MERSSKEGDSEIWEIGKWQINATYIGTKEGLGGLVWNKARVDLLWGATWEEGWEEGWRGCHAIDLEKGGDGFEKLEKGLGRCRKGWRSRRRRRKSRSAGFGRTDWAELDCIAAWSSPVDQHMCENKFNVICTIKRRRRNYKGQVLILNPFSKTSQEV